MMEEYVDDGNKSKTIEKSIKKYERGFSKRKYKGHTFGKLLGVSRNESHIAVLALNSTIVEDTEGIHPVCYYSGGIARQLAYETGCKAIYNRKRIRSKKSAYYREQLQTHLRDVNFIVIIRCHENNQTGGADIEVSLKGEEKNVSFIKRLIQYTAEYTFSKYSECVEMKQFDPALDDFFHEETDLISIVCLDYNLNSFRNKKKQFFLTFKRIISAISNMDWLAEKKQVYRIWQADAKSQIPQDKLELFSFCGNSNTDSFGENSFIHLISYTNMHETVRLRKASDNSLNRLKEYLQVGKYMVEENQFAVLTNRMIEKLYGREWFEDKEEIPGLFGVPVIAYENEKESYGVGIPKANQVNDISLSTSLFNEKIELSSKYDYMIFNRFTDSRMFIEIENSDYKDNGRVTDKKVMMPRYYRLMMGYLERPLKTIREEEYNEMYNNLDENTKKDFCKWYEKMHGQAYYQLKELENIDGPLETEMLESKERVISHLELLGVYRRVNLIRLPKQNFRTQKDRIMPESLLYRLKMKLLKKTIGKAEYILKTNWAGDTDDKNNVARLNSNMMKLIGVSENDKIIIKFGKSVITLRVLVKDELSDYEIGIPSSGRRSLDMNSMNDIVIVHRDMEHTFKRHSQEQTIAILGTVLAAAQIMTASSFFTSTWWGVVIGIVICLIAIVAMLYFALSEERVKVK